MRRSALRPVAYELFGGLVEQDATNLVTELQHDLDWVDFIPFLVADAAETARIESELIAHGERIGFRHDDCRYGTRAWRTSRCRRRALRARGRSRLYRLSSTGELGLMREPRPLIG